jgi:N-acyl homoserine lactone hydrolase
MKKLLLLIAVLGIGLARVAAASDGEVRVYALDCGHATLSDSGLASDTGELAGKPRELSNPCFLVRHPRGDLLWDAGLAPDVQSVPGLDLHAGPPLERQLAALGLTPDALQLLAFSHLHYDHVGHANAFTHATWILNRDELVWAEHEPSHVSMNPALFAGYKRAQTRFIDGDHDVFGDGRVRILHAPGHTPGSAVLWLDLRDTGPVILSGDLFLARESREHGYVPSINASRADTLASMARVERIAKRTHARIIVQHDPLDWAALPKPPHYLH